MAMVMAIRMTMTMIRPAGNLLRRWQSMAKHERSPMTEGPYESTIRLCNDAKATL